MPPRFTSFKTVWNSVMKNDIENTISPDRPVLPKRNPLSFISSRSNISSVADLLRPIQQRAEQKPIVRDPKPGNISTEVTNTDLERALSSSVIAELDICDLNSSVSNSDNGSLLGNGSHRISSVGHMAGGVPEEIPTEAVRKEGTSLSTILASARPVDTHLPTLKQPYIGTHSVSLEKRFNLPLTIAPNREPKTVLTLTTDPLHGSKLRFMIFTDTHLGHKETDPIRENDSFNAFQEVLFLAKYLQVDGILHAGDLFDDSHPSRSVIYRTMELLRRYCRKSDLTSPLPLNIRLPKSCAVRSETKRLEALKFIDGTITKEARVPFFVIHGNHDNPTTMNGLSPIDLLDVSGLVTFFGTVTDMTKVEVHPICISKGDIHLALYGMGWVKEEFLYKAFEENKVVFVPPVNTGISYYKVLLFHENRYPRRGVKAKDFIPEEFLPDWLDLVIWGHEHECLKFPMLSETRGFKVLQMGSTIQTSLATGEMEPKHCCLMEIGDDGVKFYPIYLETARQLHYSEISLCDIGVSPKGGEKDIFKKLVFTMDNILRNMPERPRTPLCISAVADIVMPDKECELSEAIESAQAMPLVRVRVDHSGYDSINPRTFGARYVDRVANPNDLLRFWLKNPVRPIKAKESPQSTHLDIRNTVYPLVEEACRLKLFLERDLNGAVERFAVGMENGAITDYISRAVRSMKEAVISDMAIHIGDHLCEEVYIGLVERAIIARTQAARTVGGGNISPAMNRQMPGSSTPKNTSPVSATTNQRFAHGKPNGYDYNPRNDQQNVKLGINIPELNIINEIHSMANDPRKDIRNEPRDMRNSRSKNDKLVSSTTHGDLPLAGCFRTGLSPYNGNHVPDSQGPSSNNTGSTQMLSSTQSSKRSRYIEDYFAELLLDENVKRACVEYLERTEKNNVAVNQGGAEIANPEYLQLDGILRNEEPLKVSDFDDGPMHGIVKNMNQHGRMHTDGVDITRTTPLNSSAGYKNGLEISLNGEFGFQSNRCYADTSKSSPSSSPKSGSLRDSQSASLSQGFRTTLISMFFNSKG
ncbi:DNA repair protein Mre11 family protein [Babesia bovis T2Bo]|uniref:DNA repair protein (Mre11) family protein n=1 Tax=Babesia bovis TaxID=5865 RepID=A7AP02_BABBO|nr:DNA repair protein Mre11 family protein [Babesia bovis T2Bo]EDO08286.1 DNA repair protein Mre11 family protein [Babesia bovis T2Bo]|eukprot:XP_001611854.1 DNA repair protein (mre11) family protein [Babesia bovis T2Bo]